jgi:S-adenosylmethionine:tRNA ribosyltransferase-isomerase
MKLSEFRYDLPSKSIAKYPADPRDESKLLVIDRESGELMDLDFNNIIDFFRKGDCLVVNDTRVYPARLFGKKEKTNAMIEVMLLRELNKDDRIWDVLVEPARKVRIGNKIYFDNNKFYCEVIDNTTSRGRTVRFSYEGDLFKVIDRIGQMPLPEYIKRDPVEDDKRTYQTIFSDTNKTSSIAPPKAGLHFTEDIIEALKSKGVSVAKISLNIGQGIFERIEVEDLTKHRMFSEYFEITKASSDIINKSLKARKNIFAVGTSVVRALESSVLTSGACKPNKGWTDKFIYPRYDFRIVSRFITGFKEPASPQLLCSAAFCGQENIFNAYKHAQANGYRFLAYGDAVMMI